MDHWSTCWSKASHSFERSIDCFELTDGCLLEIMTDNASSDFSILWEQQTTTEVCGIERPAVSNHILCMVHVIYRALGAFMSSLSVKGHTKSWEPHELD